MDSPVAEKLENSHDQLFVGFSGVEALGKQIMALERWIVMEGLT